MSVRILPRVNEIVDRRHLLTYPFFGPNVAGGAATRVRARRAGGLASYRAGHLRAKRAGGIVAVGWSPA